MSPHSQSPRPSITVERASTPTASQIQPQDDAPEAPLSPTAAPRVPPYIVIWRWMQGPNPPKDVTFTPFFAKWQDLPLRLLYRGRLRRRKLQLALLLLFWFAWLTTFITVIHNSRFTSKVNGQNPYFISCSSVLWYVLFSSPPPPLIRPMFCFVSPDDLQRFAENILSDDWYPGRRIIYVGSTASFVDHSSTPPHRSDAPPAVSALACSTRARLASRLLHIDRWLLVGLPGTPAMGCLRMLFTGRIHSSALLPSTPD